MAVLIHHWEHRTPIPPAKAREWWFDLREDDHGVPEYGDKAGMAKRVIEARSAKQVRTRDTWRDWTFPAVVTKEGDHLAYVVGEGKYVNEATLRFHPDGAGTRLVWDGRVTVKGFFGLIVPLMKGRLNREFEEDMGLHARHMAREWAEKPW